MFDFQSILIISTDGKYIHVFSTMLYIFSLCTNNFLNALDFNKIIYNAPDCIFLFNKALHLYTTYIVK